jgi:hypothetical protein
MVVQLVSLFGGLQEGFKMKYCLYIKASKKQPDGITDVTLAQQKNAKKKWNSLVSFFDGNPLGTQSQDFIRGTKYFQGITWLPMNKSVDDFADNLESGFIAANVFEWWELWYHPCTNEERKPCTPWKKIRNGVGV